MCCGKVGAGGAGGWWWTGGQGRELYGGQVGTCKEKDCNWNELLMLRSAERETGHARDRTEVRYPLS